MNVFKRALLGLCLGFGLAAHAGATVVNLSADGQWHSFDVDPLSASSGGFEWIDYADGSPLSFVFESAVPMWLTIVDGGFAGDVFELRDGGVLLGSSSAATNNYPDSTGLDFDAAMANAFYSKGSFLLAPGSHTITGVLLTSAMADFGPLDATVGAVMLTAAEVPEPSQWATLLSGMLMLSWTQRARRSRK